MKSLIETIEALKYQKSEVVLPDKYKDVESMLLRFGLTVFLNLVNSFVSSNWKKVLPHKVGKIVSGK